MYSGARNLWKEVKAVTLYFELEEDAMNLEQVVITGTWGGITSKTFL